MPQRAAADYASRLRQMAEQLPPEQQSYRADLIALADAFERAINNTNNTIAGVVGTIELGLSERIEAVASQVDNLQRLFDRHDKQEAAERQELASQIGELQQAVSQVLGLLRDEPPHER